MSRAATGLLLVVLAAAAWVPGAGAGWTAAQVANATDTARTGRLSLDHAWGSGTCAGTGPADTACAGAPLPTGPSTGSTQTQADTLRNTTPSGSSTQQVQVVSCAPARFADSATATDPMLPRYGVTRGATDPWGTGVAAGFDGSTQYAADVVPTTTSLVAGSSYSLGLWFRAPLGSGGGGLLSLNASPVASTSAGANPTLYLDGSGRIRAKLDGTPVLVLPVILVLTSASGTDYRDGRWHHVALTVNRKVLTTDLKLYVDGAQADAINDAVLLIGTLSDSWWHLAWTDTTALSGLGDPPASFTGRLSGAFRTTTALSAATVAALASSASATSYASALASAQHLWMLGDASTATHTGAIAYVTGGAPCAHVRLGWSLGGTTAFALTPIDQLAGVGWLPAMPAAAPGPGATQTLTTSYARVASGYDSDVAGLELVVPLAHRVLLTGTAWTLRFDWGAARLLG
ncbi:LamG-like jellyroll fold domain-containing protein [Nocardioides sp. LML1-1-1.1]|uniref:LamG-like jellyroll fold domain-containing protein n=1 Tax=Nocardioides sp. LML1-1-1.1 TaxID=3135248 RepID=UPI0034326056